MALLTAEVTWLRWLLADFGVSADAPTPLLSDSTGAISIARDPVKHELTKHIGVDAFYVRHAVQHQVVAIKIQVIVDNSRSTEQGNSREEFLSHVRMLSRLHHRNVVDFIGYCADDHHRILVHEFMPLCSLQDHLHDSDPSRDKAARLDWNSRMKIAVGVAKGLGYLHEHGVVYRGMQCSNILLGDGYHPKLSEPGMAELGRPQVDLENTQCLKRVAFGYLAPETTITGWLSMESDVYNFGVVLLVMITGRRAFDSSPAVKGEPRLAAWAQPLLEDSSKFPGMVDPALEGRYALAGLNRAMDLVSTCIREHPAMRPSIGTVIEALTHIADSPAEPLGTSTSLIGEK
ncbi:hypothetical protein QYE76_067904 [Lolium multiflorum]|uniref:Protein kinase domain-containing protein n=1 Tax=Lolium multiflorum TaxID=4521 RepID=A0AAD8SDP7_LOLMU|nr:hypothetical protein QYE76_067904 [Lolium multiflorum]